MVEILFFFLISEEKGTIIDENGIKKYINKEDEEGGCKEHHSETKQSQLGWYC